MNKTLKILQDRGFIKACTDLDALSDLMDREPVSFYVGVDPTGQSVHIGHMVPFFAMHHMQEGGHNPIALVGGGTAMIGDPSGKTEMRKMLTKEQIASNVESIKKQLGTVIDFSDTPASGWGKAKIANNGDWLLGLNYIDFLREIGSQFSVNRMLTFESYKQRLERGLSFIEFNYQLLQSYDFLMLYRNEGCRLQMGGDDQWGNIVAGIDLIRRMESAECFGLTFNLIMRADGQKMGKSEKGAVFLDPTLYSPYDFYQYWRNVNDEDVIRFMKLFTFLTLEEISGYEKSGVNINEAKERLAWEQTKIIHGQEEADKARDAAKAVFGGAASPAAREGMPSMEMDSSELRDGKAAVELFVSSGLVSSNSDGRRLISGGGAHINDRKIESHDQSIDMSWCDDQGELILRSGKKKFFRITVK